jgi:CysZ protein
MARHLYPFGQVLAALRRRLTLALGFGAALYVMLWVPVLNFFLMPVAVVAGTLLYRALRQAGAVSGPPEAR